MINRIQIVAQASFIVMCACVFTFSHALEEDLEFQVVGKITERCELNVVVPSGGYIDPANSADNSAGLEIDCNTPMLLDIKSANGGLLTSDFSGDAARLHEYDISLRIQSLGLDVQASSQELRQTVTYSSNSIVPFVTQGQFDLTLREPLRYAGNYEDILYFDIKPNLDIGID